MVRKHKGMDNDLRPGETEAALAAMELDRLAALTEAADEAICHGYESRDGADEREYDYGLE
ncbi:MAG: hypothetical protein NUV75_01340 [Gallionella sp.]|nr:hypothetical protein [Gallionella sp.]